MLEIDSMLLLQIAINQPKILVQKRNIGYNFFNINFTLKFKWSEYYSKCYIVPVIYQLISLKEIEFSCVPAKLCGSILRMEIALAETT